MSLSQKIILGSTLLVCTLALSLPMVRNGLTYQFGLGFWGPSGHDGIWHLSLITHLHNPFSVKNPSFSGQSLINYHPFFDILTALVAQSLHLPESFVLFQIMPIFMSLILLYLSFLVGQSFTKTFLGGLLLVFLNTFASSFGFLVTLLRHRQLGGESLFWAMQSLSTQINPPYALSLIFLLLFLLLLRQQKPKTIHYLSLSLLLILSPITKAYAGVVIFFVYGVYCLLKKDRRHLLTLIISLVLSYLLFKHQNPSGAGLLEFNPLWFIRSLFESPDKLYLPKIASYLLNTRFNFNH